MDHKMHPEYPWDDCGAPECDDQLAVFSKVGRGLQGKGFKVVIREDNDSETYLEGLSYDPASKTYTSEWITGNINGGHLTYQYNLRPFTDPKTFTITFRMQRPGRDEWHWTTPAIPYVYDEPSDDNIGSGVGTVYIKKNGTQNWIEKLIYPDGTTGEDYNAPNPEDPWSVNLTYGSGGDIDVPAIDEIAAIVGVTPENIRNIIAGSGSTGLGNSDNLKDYIDDQDAALLTHVHNDLGFPANSLAGDGGTTEPNTVKEYIDGKFSSLQILNVVRPVGSTYISTNGENPNSLFPGTEWVADKTGRYLKSTSSESDHAQGGSSSQTITQDNIPLRKHEHAIAMSTNYRMTACNGGDPTDASREGQGGVARSTDASVGYNGGILISMGMPENGHDETDGFRLMEPPNGKTADLVTSGAAKKSGNVPYSSGDYAHTGNESANGSFTINNPSYITVTIWRRTA